MLLLLPANATHLIQQLDIAGLKKIQVIVIMFCIIIHVIECCYTYHEKKTRNIGSKTWREGIQYKTKNIDSSFRASCLWFFFPLTCSAA